MISDLRYERGFWDRGLRVIAGVDEAGRGPLAGPVVAAAVVFPPGTWIEGIDDSKKLSRTRREALAELIRREALCVGVAVVSERVIDEVNIFQATMRAMNEAVSKLRPPPDHVLVDGPHFRGCPIPSTPVVGGDRMCFSIASASIVAKVTRDALMVEFDRRYPVYGFARHMGYATREHIEAIRRHGPCEIHRRSFHVRSLIGPEAP